ncbi:MAG: hypothetical protein ACD_60C00102G0001 [uncultured bacterium]|nr:MAG: hypothetical protein ACD_60C00102G0001 [uncultured bacterium]
MMKSVVVAFAVVALLVGSTAVSAKKGTATFTTIGVACACGSGRVCVGPRGGKYCIAPNGAKRYGK